jgi:hypothetical protein
VPAGARCTGADRRPAPQVEAAWGDALLSEETSRLLVQFSPRIPRASFASLPGLNHVEGFYRIDLAAPYVLAFLATVPQRRRPPTSSAASR